MSSCCLKIGRGDIQKAENNFWSDRKRQQTLWDWFRRCLSACCHHDRAGRMESGCVKVSILLTTIEGLLSLLPPGWLALQQSPKHGARSSPFPAVWNHHLWKRKILNSISCLLFDTVKEMCAVLGSGLIQFLFYQYTGTVILFCVNLFLQPDQNTANMNKCVIIFPNSRNSPQDRHFWASV